LRIATKTPPSGGVVFRHSFVRGQQFAHERHSREHNSGALVFGALLLACAAIYIPGLNGGFFFDDIPNIVDNPILGTAAGSDPNWLAVALFPDRASFAARSACCHSASISAPSAWMRSHSRP
jgi:hypothetical protein